MPSFFLIACKMVNQISFPSLSLLVIHIFGVSYLLGHPSPNTLILLDIGTRGVHAELHIPVSELALALHPNAPNSDQVLHNGFKDSIETYLLAHILPVSLDGRKWSVQFKAMKLVQVDAQQRNTIQDFIIQLWFQPPPGVSTRQFILNYDVIMHQVLTHSAIVSIRHDWETGVVAEHPSEIGVIAVDPRSNQIFPLTVYLENRGLWGGFLSMIRLGRLHIAQGMDHLLFLLTLLLTAPLRASDRRWSHFGGWGYAWKRLLWIITAFTIGHSLTLMVAALDLIDYPIQVVEFLIAVSIIISAVHAIRPLFPDQEFRFTAGFGLIHGLAFADTLNGLDLNLKAMILSILGFNLGIELQQLLIVAFVVPALLILLSRFTSIYSFIRIIGATFALLAALAWSVERASGQKNFFTLWLEHFV